MTILFMDGCDLYAAAGDITRRWTSVAGSTMIVSNTGRFGGGSIGVPANTSSVQWTIGSTKATLAAHFAVLFPERNSTSGNNDEGANSQVLEFRNSTTVIITLAYDFPSANWKVYQGTTAGTLLGSFQQLHGYAWNHICLKVLRHASAGTVDLYLNGHSVIALTGQNTGASDFDNIRIRGSTALNANECCRFDDFVLTDGTVYKDCRIETLTPSSDTAQADFTPSTGTNHSALVDELPPNGDTDYNSSATLNHYDRYNMSNMHATPTSVAAVQINLTARLSASDSSAIRTKLKSGATTDNGSNSTLTNAFSFVSKLYEQDPNAGPGAWTASAVDALEAGCEIVTANGATMRLTSCVLEVLADWDGAVRVSNVVLEAFVDVTTSAPPSTARPIVIVST